MVFRFAFVFFFCRFRPTDNARSRSDSATATTETDTQSSKSSVQVSAGSLDVWFSTRECRVKSKNLKGPRLEERRDASESSFSVLVLWFVPYSLIPSFVSPSSWHSRYLSGQSGPLFVQLERDDFFFRKSWHYIRCSMSFLLVTFHSRPANQHPSRRY